jgi:hypothetical protein
VIKRTSAAFLAGAALCLTLGGHPALAYKSVNAVAAPDPGDVTYPLQCSRSQPLVLKRASGDLSGDSRPETVAVVSCPTSSEYPPTGIYVLAAPPGERTRVVATLLDPKDRMSVSDFAIREGAVFGTLLGYSSSAVPRCCPDHAEHVKWKWNDGKFIRSHQAPPR